MISNLIYNVVKSLARHISEAFKTLLCIPFVVDWARDLRESIFDFPIVMRTALSYYSLIYSDILSDDKWWLRYP